MSARTPARSKDADRYVDLRDGTLHHGTLVEPAPADAVAERRAQAWVRTRVGRHVDPEVDPDSGIRIAVAVTTNPLPSPAVDAEVVDAEVVDAQVRGAQAVDSAVGGTVPGGTLPGGATGWQPWQRWYVVALVGLDATAFALGGLAAVHARFGTVHVPVRGLAHLGASYADLAVGGALPWVAVCALSGAYAPGCLSRWSVECRRVAAAGLRFAAVGAVLVFASKVDLSRGAVAPALVASTVLALTLRLGGRLLLRLLRLHSRPRGHQPQPRLVVTPTPPDVPAGHVLLASTPPALPAAEARPSAPEPPLFPVRPLAGRPLRLIVAPRFCGARGVLKRAVDVVGAVVLLVVLLPVLLLVAMLVALTCAGTVLRREQCVGRDGAAFTRFGFAGRWLRRSSLDRLPQLVNVLLGQMSLVGTRAPGPTEVASYPGDVQRRLVVRPGMIGLWQVNGRPELPWSQTAQQDLYYVENSSIALDLEIAGKVLRAAVRGPRAV